jgi:hypothetical protein
MTTCPFANSPLEPCCGFFVLNFESFNFDAYDTYFRDDSTLTLSQAGTYKGAAGIMEYVKFASDSSPYFSDYEVPGGFIRQVKGFDGATCVFSSVGAVDYVLDKDVVGDDTEFKVAQLSNVYYNITDGKIDKINLYYANGFLDFFFGKLDSPKVNKFICDIMEDSCGFKIHSTRACKKRLERLPVLQGDSYIDGDSQGCRVLHAVLAEGNPDLHCAHINFKDLPDPNGNIKCSVSAGIDPDDLFDEGDFGFYNDLCDSYDIDPEIGYIVL